MPYSFQKLINQNIVIQKLNFLKVVHWRFMFLFLFAIIYTNSNAQLSIEEIGFLPEPISNNAVVEGYLNGVPYLFTFGGIDQTKSPSGIHLRSYRVNLETGDAEAIPDLPDNMGKIAAGASRIGNIIYIAGGYYVFDNFSELSSDKMHRYDIENNVYLEDAPPIPFATDDHVQVVWRDSLIYLITGWSNTTNVPYVQIYDPSTNGWTRANNLPVDNRYRSFGASGAIVNDTIYYFGGASSTSGFNIQNHLRKGVINPDNPAEVSWSISTPDPAINGYRMACTTVGEEIHWLGGSTITYNFDGIAYNGSGGVPPADRDLFSRLYPFNCQSNSASIPMDLRGIASINDTIKYIAGGMLENQEVTHKVLKLQWANTTTNIQETHVDPILIYPNPFQSDFTMRPVPDQAIIYDLNGKVVYEAKSTETLILDFLRSGIYFLKSTLKNKTIVQKIMKL